MESYMSESGFDSLFSKVSLIEKAWKYFLINVHPSNEINHKINPITFDFEYQTRLTTNRQLDSPYFSPLGDFSHPNLDPEVRCSCRGACNWWKKGSRRVEERTGGHLSSWGSWKGGVFPRDDVASMAEGWGWGGAPPQQQVVLLLHIHTTKNQCDGDRGVEVAKYI